MASIVLGYEYDIFISYRQKDNKYDGWVTEFVDNLKRELDATFKEEVSVYFDMNLMTDFWKLIMLMHHLKEKLKCLDFYSDYLTNLLRSKIFAWQHEFVAFNKMAKEDPFGRDIKLGNGNIARQDPSCKNT